MEKFINSLDVGTKTIVMHIVDTIDGKTNYMGFKTPREKEMYLNALYYALGVCEGINHTSDEKCNEIHAYINAHKIRG